MNVRLVAPSDLTTAQLAAWGGIQAADPRLASPYFHPEYAIAVAAVRDDVQVAVLEIDGDAVGFVPFQRSRRNVARPVGGRLTDLWSPIVRQDVRWDPMQLVRDARLSALKFHGAFADDIALSTHHRIEADSPYLDLLGGFEAYERGRRDAGSQVLTQLRRKERKIQREVGPLRFVLHTHEDRVFEALLEWKSAQRRRTKTVDLLRFSWAVDLLRRVRMTERPSFAGVLSALYAGDRLAAVHLGMRGDRVFHYWIPTYNLDFEPYSPGLLLLLALARVAPSLGIERIDLGKGDERYKRRLKNGSMTLVEGAVARDLLSRVGTGAWYVARRWARRLPARHVLQGAKRRIHRWYHAFELLRERSP